MSAYDHWKRWQYYIIIGVISMVALLFLPMVGSEAGLAWNVPTTTVGWIVYMIGKLIVAVINILIFHCFVLQGKTNVQNHPNYIKATEILCEIDNTKEHMPKSPHQWYIGVYGKKGTVIFLTSALSAVGLTQAVLSFDWITFLTYLFTILTGIIFGILQMNQTEVYWTEEYLNYAKLQQRRMQDDNCKRSTAQEP